MLTEPAKHRGKSKSLPPALIDTGDGARRQMDEIMIQVWEDRFKAQSDQIKELTQTVRGFNGTPGVMERLGIIETAVKEIHALLTAKSVHEPDGEKKGLTKDQLASMALGFMKPVITAIIIWALLTFFPQLLVHVGMP